MPVSHSALNVNVLLGTFNQKKALVSSRTFVCSSSAEAVLAVLSGPDAGLEEGGARCQEHFPTLSRRCPVEAICHAAT